MCIYICVYICIHIHICMCICIHICVCVCIIIENLYLIVYWFFSFQGLLFYPEVSLRAGGLPCHSDGFVGALHETLDRCGRQSGKEIGRDRELLAWTLGFWEPFLSAGGEKEAKGPCMVPLCHTWERWLEKWLTCLFGVRSATALRAITQSP